MSKHNLYLKMQLNHFMLPEKSKTVGFVLSHVLRPVARCDDAAVGHP